MNEGERALASMTREELDRLIAAASRGARDASHSSFVIEEAVGRTILALVERLKAGELIAWREAWCRSTARNLAWKLARREKRWTPLAGDELMPTLLDDDSTPPDESQAWNLARVGWESFLKRCPSRLAARRKEIVSVALLGYGWTATSELLGMSLAHLRRSIDRLVRDAQRDFVGRAEGLTGCTRASKDRAAAAAATLP